MMGKEGRLKYLAPGLARARNKGRATRQGLSHRKGGNAKMTLDS